MLQINSDCNWISMLSSGNTGAVGTDRKVLAALLLSVAPRLFLIQVQAMRPALRC